MMLWIPSCPNAEERLAKQQRAESNARALMFPFAALAVLGTQAAAQRSPKNRLSSPILGSQPAAAPAGDRDVAQRRVLSGYVMTDSNIYTARDAWFSNSANAEATYGHISTWETSGVTDMMYLFCPCTWDSGTHRG